MQYPKKEIPNVICTLVTTCSSIEHRHEGLCSRCEVLPSNVQGKFPQRNSRSILVVRGREFEDTSRYRVLRRLVFGSFLSQANLEGEFSNQVSAHHQGLLTCCPLFFNQDDCPRLELRKINGLHYITLEEDLTHPIMDQTGFLASPFLPFAKTFLGVGCLFSNMGACLFRTVGLLQGGAVSYADVLEAARLAQVEVLGDEVYNSKEQHRNDVSHYDWLS
ncbi:hypothetical protein PAXINDRAFT_179371 [Paxillus involutus ATCC 200175]|nr:hypothetical protein PAXINDRAFT_179371 [Paxillus involutus ATCC 200175]